MASGRPDWYSSVAMHGKHLNDYITVAVDIAGNMLGIMQGKYDDVLKPIAVDSKGVMQAIETSPETIHYHGDWVGVEDGEDSIEYGAEGKGTLWSLICRVQGVSVAAQSSFTLKTDGDSLPSPKICDLLSRGFVMGNGFPLTLLELDYSGASNYATLVLVRPIYFDTSFGVTFSNRSGLRINFSVNYDYMMF